MRAETRVTGLLRNLRDCLCVALAESVGGPVCLCSFLHSDQVVLDGCDAETSACDCDDASGHGRAYVRVSKLQARIPAQTGQTGGCATAGWGGQLEIGVMRCVPDCRAELRSSEVEEEMAVVALADYAAVKRAVACCPKSQGYSAVVTAWQPIGPEGCCYGGIAEITAQIG